MTDIDTALAQIKQQLNDKQYDQALLNITPQLVQYPEHAELWYLKSVCQRYLKLSDAAIESLQTLLALQPEYGRAFQELGHNFSALSRMQDAAEAYQQAVQRNNALPASWRGLAVALKQLGQEQEAAAALNQFQYLNKQAPILLSIASMRNEGRLYKAERLCRDFLQQHPHDPSAMRLLGLIGMDLGVLDDADFVLESCLELHPDFDQARIDFITVLQKRQQFKRAMEQANILLDKQPNNITALTAGGNAAMSIGDLELALTLFDRALLINANLQGVQLAKGHALKTAGDTSGAVDCYRKAYEIQSDFGDAYWSLANLKTYRFSDGEIKIMKNQLEVPTISLVDRYSICFALAKSLEDSGDYSQSFHYYQRGNQLKKQQIDYSAENNKRDTQLQIQVCTKNLFTVARGYEDKAPIFIVGLPRAGSTLLEQILSSHSMVEGTLELPNIPAMAHKLNGRRRRDEEPKYPGVLAELTPEQCLKLGRQYIEETRIHRTDTPFFIDKMPNNFRHIGLIKTILPNAKIIDARRHPLACCFSAFKQLFAEGQLFSYSLDDLAGYYIDYTQLMTHWDDVFPGAIHRVFYEQVVDDLELEVRRLLEYCQLPFEPQCLEFHKTRRAVRTASAEQVRQPLYRGGIDQWQNFAEQLDPLVVRLADVLSHYPCVDK
ncbi:tetratricopeptide repeat-containing sulfotransferase family protein [Oceanicoccus sp. KOV_DT_Chl]|uniref:tetratricopeptide repeat-containing sulfotransferase family protein n=1 Tax=Oceanicoccus sp. KOV_DT_Chl TaxID=1904639 RepID=UPI000C7A5199|nr:tetratricopeptide repeat-containing sulfotransferase family protein [Oceanicoccus sp. KOV_DT_Chl]